jgi:ATP-binding cassette subfamily B protein
VKAIVAALRTLPRVSKPLTIGLASAVVFGALVPNAFRLATGAVVGTLPAAIAGGSDSSAAHRVLVLVAVSGLLFALQQIAMPLLNATAAALGRRLTSHLRHRVMAATVVPPGIAHLEDPDLLNKVALAQGVGTGDITPRELVLAIAVVGHRYLSVAVAAALLAAFNAWLALAITLAILLVITRFKVEFRKSAEVLVGRAETTRRSAYFRDAALTPAAAKETRVFGLDRWLGRRFDDAWRTAITDIRRGRRGSWRLVAWGPWVFFAIDIVVYVVLGRAAVRGEISIGEFVVFAQAANGVGMLGNLSQHDLWLQYAAPAVVAAMELEEVVQRPEIRLAGREPATGLPRREIRFQGVEFHYPGQSRAIYDGLDLTIPAGRSLAIVGDNGAGKTTLVKLLARLYDPTSGRITVDGVDLRSLDPAEWQGRIGAIFQDFVRYQLSVIDNVGFSADGSADRAALVSAARRAGALDVIESLPSEWDTVLSRQFEGGTDLSGGQWQRVALARALYAVEQGAGVLVLDEPSANLDVRAEADLYDRFLDLTGGLTTILISHRFSTVRRADRIVVLDGGRVVEDGSHDELISAGGRYAHMFGLQAARFAS